MTPLSIHLAALGMAILILFCMGTQVSLASLRRGNVDWRTLAVICLGQWALLPGVVLLFLMVAGNAEQEVLAIVIIALSPGGVFACAALYLIGINFTAAVAAILLLEVLGALVLHALVDMLVATSMFSPGLLQSSLRDISQSQLTLLFLPLLVGVAMRFMWPALGERLARTTRVLIWIGYATVAAYALSLKAHFSYRIDVMSSLPVAVGIIFCGVAAGFVVYLLSHYVLRLRGHDALLASTLIGLQGPGPAIFLTLLHGDEWTELAAITINYALLLPLLAIFWQFMSKTRWGTGILPR